MKALWIARVALVTAVASHTIPLIANYSETKEMLGTGASTAIAYLTYISALVVLLVWAFLDPREK